MAERRKAASRPVGWVVYILECANGALYTGITKDLARRLAQHGEGTGAKYTRGRGPHKLVYTETRRTQGQALRREAEIKSFSRPKKLALAAGTKRNTG